MKPVSARAHRVFLVLLFVLFATLQARLTWTTLQFVASPQSVPRQFADVDGDTFALRNLRDYMKKAGAREGDKLVALEGQPPASLMDVIRRFYRHAPGKPVRFTLQRGTAAAFDLFATPEPRRIDDATDALLPLFTNVLTPWFCLLLGFGVAWRKPGDPVAYSLLALLLCLSQFIRAEGQLRWTWEVWLTYPMIFCDAFCVRALVPAWLWFSLTFPDPKSKYVLLPWAKWLLTVPYLIHALIYSGWATVALHHAGLVDSWEHWLDLPNGVERLWLLAMGLLGLSNLIYKAVRETEAGVQRRLRWMIAGLVVGMAPIALLVMFAAATHRELNNFPTALLMIAVTAPLLIPLTLAYTVLVTRLYNVGVFVRQSLLATQSVNLMRTLLLGGLVWSAATAAVSPMGPSQKILVLVVHLGLCVIVAWGANRSRTWVDRRFFRSALESERLLTDLTTELRHMRDPQAIADVMTERVATTLKLRSSAVLLRRDGRFVVRSVAGELRQSPAPLMSNSTDFPSGTDHVSVCELSEEDPVVARIHRERQPWLAAEHPFEDPRGSLRPLQAEVMVPIVSGDVVEGIWTLGSKFSEEPFSKRDLNLIHVIASQAALALENSRLAEEVAQEAAQRGRIQSELEIAWSVQQRLFPRTVPVVEGLEIAGRCLPAQTVGGDYYDFVSLADGSVALAIGDVAGKGVPAALLMASLQASFRGLAFAGISDLAELMAKLNVLVYDASPANRFATFFCCVYDPTSRTLRYSSAGHCPALLVRRDGSTLWLRTKGTGLGLKRSMVYEEQSLQLASGDLLVLYTDGVTEARTEVEEFEESRLVATVLSSGQAGAVEVLEGIVGAVTEFASGHPQHDDLTLVTARCY